MKLFYKSAWLLLGAVVFFGGAGLVATWAPDKPVSELTARWAALVDAPGPSLAAISIYLLMVIVLYWKPQGLFPAGS